MVYLDKAVHQDGLGGLDSVEFQDNLEHLDRVDYLGGVVGAATQVYLVHLDNQV